METLLTWFKACRNRQTVSAIPPAVLQCFPLKWTSPPTYRLLSLQLEQLFCVSFSLIACPLSISFFLTHSFFYIYYLAFSCIKFKVRRCTHTQTNHAISQVVPLVSATGAPHFILTDVSYRFAHQVSASVTYQFKLSRVFIAHGLPVKQ